MKKAWKAFWIGVASAINVIGAWHLLAPEKYHWMGEGQLWVVIAIFGLTAVTVFYDHGKKVIEKELEKE